MQRVKAENSGNSPPTRTALFLGYSKIGLMGFGGVAGVARHVIVNERQWLDDRDYAATLGLGQLLPGPNVVNAGVMIGARFHGVSGALAALGGIMGGPLCVLVLIILVYDRYAELAWVQTVIAGSAAGAAGIVIGTGLKMLRRVRPGIAAFAISLAAALGAGLFHLPLLLIVACLTPLGILAEWRKARV